MDSMDGIDFSQSEAFRELVSEVRRALEEQQQQRQTEHRPDLEAEREQQAGQMNGYLQTLGKPDLHPDVRDSVEAAMVQLRERQRNLEVALAEQQAAESAAALVVDPGEVQDRLNRLSDVLAGSNASMANLELSLHIDCIRCSSKKVEIRTCRLGALAGAVDLLAEDVDAPENDRPVRPRRRALLRIEDGSDSELRDVADFVADPHRFAGLDERWFHTDVFQIPEQTGWYEDHAVEVARKRADGLTYEQLAEHFGVTVPTIRKALRHAVEADPSLEPLLKKMPRRQWHVDHVLARHHAGMGVPAMAKHFGKSEPTIRKSLDHAREFGLLND